MMRSPLKIAAIIFVIMIGLAGSYYIIKNSAPAVSMAGEETQKISELGNKLLKEVPIIWKEKLGNLTESLSENSEEWQSSVDSDNQQSVNLTELLAKSLFTQMKTLDQSGRDPFAGFDPDDPESQRLLVEAVENLGNPAAFLGQSVDDADLKISGDNSRIAKINYLTEIEQITRDRFNNPKYQRSAEQIIEDINQDCFIGAGTSSNRDVASLYQNLTNDYLNLDSPSDWVDVHRQIIIYFKNAGSIYGALADCANDPIKGYLAAQTMPDLLSRASETQKLLDKKIQEVNL